MSTFLADVAPSVMEYDSGSGIVNTITTSSANNAHEFASSKTIDLIGEEFAPRGSNIAGKMSGAAPNVVVVSAVPIPNSSGVVTTNASQLLQTLTQTSSGGQPIASSATPIPVSIVGGNIIVSSTANEGNIVSLVESQPHTVMQQPQQQQQLPLSAVTVDLPGGANSTTAPGAGNVANSVDENGGVLLCNLDELSRYIPENFYSDFNLSDTTSLEATTTAVPSLSQPTATATIAAAPSSSGTKVQNVTPIFSLANGTILQASSPITTLATSLQTSTVTPSIGATGAAPAVTAGGSAGSIIGAPGGSSASGGPVTIQLPTQPQPVQAVKSVTYVQTKAPGGQQTLTTGSSFQPVKLTTTGFAVTPTGERIAIKGLADAPAGQVLQLKPGAQTIQLQGLQGLQSINIDPSKLTVLQELPDVSKVVIQEPRLHQDSISNILEEMKSEDINSTANLPGVEYATAIPVAVTNLKEPQKGIKRVGPASTIVLPSSGKKSISGSSPASISTAGGPRNIIFAGNTLPQGAIPVQINGLSTLNALPISAVKSIPLPINLSSLTPTSAPVLTTASIPQVVSAKKTKVEVSASSNVAASVSSIVNRVSNNNTLKSSVSGAASSLSKSSSSAGGSAGHQTGGHLSTKPIGNNKTCNWQFENGEVCGKTFSKSYNLVVHMRMHEDVRPFQCSLCDQTFRQKAHLQRHETTHGIGAKVTRTGGSVSPPKRKRKRSSRSGGSVISPAQPAQHSAHLQARLARVSEQFGTAVATAIDGKEEVLEDETGEDDEETLYHVDQTGVVKSYAHKRKYSEATTAEVEAAINAVVQQQQESQAGVIELKDGEAFLAAATGSTAGAATADGEKPGKIIRLEKNDGTGEVIQVSTLPASTQAGAVVVTTSASSALEAAVSEAISGVTPTVVTLPSGAVTSADKTIVISGLDEHKDIFNAILVEESAAGSGAPTAVQVSEAAGEVVQRVGEDEANVVSLPSADQVQTAAELEQQREGRKEENSTVETEQEKNSVSAPAVAAEAAQNGST